MRVIYKHRTRMSRCPVACGNLRCRGCPTCGETHSKLQTDERLRLHQEATHHLELAHLALAKFETGMFGVHMPEALKPLHEAAKKAVEQASEKLKQVMHPDKVPPAGAQPVPPAGAPDTRPAVAPDTPPAGTEPATPDTKLMSAWAIPIRKKTNMYCVHSHLRPSM